MKYDFDSVINRRDTDSVKWDVKDNELPMWVADMDFKAAPEILDAISIRLGHGVMGYPTLHDDWYDAYTGWWKNRHGFEMDKNALLFCTGVMPAISCMIRVFTGPGENVLIQPPVYTGFFNVIKGNGRRVSENPLVYKDGRYEMDLEDLGRKMADPKTRLMILCNPANPAGNIWEKAELKAIGELAKKHGVTVISDEIHCDITVPGKSYNPFAGVSDVCAETGIACISPTKAFNLAGLKTAAVYVSNKDLRDRVTEAFMADELFEPNSFAGTAAIAAFTKGEEWLDELLDYLSENRKTVDKFIREELPRVKLVTGEATYLLWLDVSGLGGDVSHFGEYLRENTGLWLSPGFIFGEQGNNFLRMNIACPRSVLEEGLSRLKSGAGKWLLR